MTESGWCLVLAIWGDRYGDSQLNSLVKSVRSLSPSCTDVIVFTDRYRPGLRPPIVQKCFPKFFDRELFYGWGYIVKLSVFSRDDLPRNARCVYLDLDTVCIGDLGRIAALVTGPNQYYMLPPGNLIGFGRLRRTLYRLSRKRRFATGNSSVIAYSSAAEPNLCEAYQTFFQAQGQGERYMQIDDVFISWFAQLQLRGVPPNLAVTFRREFLSRGRLAAWAKRWLPSRRRRRESIAAITFNGAEYKPASLLALKEGDRIYDGKGRTGRWSRDEIGPLFDKIVRYCQDVGTR